MIFDVTAYVFDFGSLSVINRNKMFFIITQLEICFIKNLIFLDMIKHLQSACPLIKIIIIGK